MKRINHPIEKAFDSWIKESPESFHPCDMRRFYILVKTIIRFSRSDKSKTSTWLKDNIKTSANSHILSDKDIDSYCYLFRHLIEFSKVYPLSLYKFDL